MVAPGRERLAAVARHLRPPSSGPAARAEGSRAATSGKPAAAPNVIVIVADQLRPFELGCHGGPVRTPHIDALAARGVRFEHAVTNNPVCQPARSCLLSGQHSRSCIGHLGNDSVDTAGKGWGSLAPEFPERERGAHIPGAALPEILAQNGWDTMAVGKWHLRPDPTALGFRVLM